MTTEKIRSGVLNAAQAGDAGDQRARRKRPNNRRLVSKSLIGAPEFSTFSFSLDFFPCRSLRVGEVLALARAIRTNYEVARWTAVQTMLAIGLVLPATAMGLLWLYGGDLSRPVSGIATLRFCLALSAIEALVFAPAVAVRSSRTLRELTLARDDLDRLAHFDSLTGLFNRRGFDKAAAGALASPTAPGRPAAALMCDLDYFKRVNDQFGHEFGDVALRHVANILREAAGGDKMVLGRIGGEEFALLLTDFQLADAFAFAENLCVTIAQRPVEWRGAKATITMSVGFAAAPFWQGEVSPLLARADEALYRAKRLGRNRVVAAQEFRVEAASERRQVSGTGRPENPAPRRRRRIIAVPRDSGQAAPPRLGP